MRPLLVASLAALLGAAEPALRLDTGWAVPIAAPGATPAALVVANPGDQPLSARLTGTVTEFDGTVVKLDQDCQVPARGEARIAVPLGAGRLGMRWVAAALPGAKPFAGGFVHAPPAGNPKDPTGFWWGVCSHPGRVPPAEREREMQAAAAVGFTLMRAGKEWSQIERPAGTWDWSAFDDIVERAGRHGIELQTILGMGHPDHAVPAVKAAFEAAKARKDPQAWEEWHHAEYIAMMRSAGEVMRATDPEAVMLSGGFATVLSHPHRHRHPDFQERVLREASDLFQIHAHHEHGLFQGFQQAVDGELARMRKGMKVQRPLFFNETAMHSCFATEHVQAVTLVKKVAFARARGAVGYTWYDLRNDGTDPANAEHNYGLVTRDFQAKAAYAAWNQLMRELHGLAFQSELALGAGRYGYVFAASGRRVAVLWNEDVGLADEPIAIRAPGCAAGQAVDIMGNAQALPARDGALVVRPGAQPSYIELPGGGQPVQVVGALVALAGQALAAPGERLALAVRLANPLARPLALRLDWPGGGQRIELAADERRELRIDAACPAGEGGRASLALRYAVEGGPWEGTVAVPVQLVRSIPAGEPAGRAPDFACDAMASVVNFCQTDPTLQACNWRGPEDLSMQVWLARGGGALRLHVAVRDDLHHQVESADSAWRGDGLQVGFQVPGEAGSWELGVARHQDGRVLRSLWIKPAGAATGPEAFTASATPVPGGMVYDLALPYAAFGLSDAVLERGLRFNLLANDNDGPLREGFVRVAPGMGERKDPAVWPLVRF
ncbi:MAG: hypothetical protein L6R48_07430 [Planctomycetes bacterium]|nr:hypothetical protein [Planctomycetota bacterium]